MSSPQEMGRLFERRLAKRHGLKYHKGSGASWYKKGDASTNSLFFEIKYTEASQFIIKDDLIRKIRKECGPHQDYILYIRTEASELIVLDANLLDHVMECWNA